MLSYDNKYQSYSTSKVQKYDDDTIFCTKNDFVALLCACHEKLRLYQLALSVSFPQTPYMMNSDNK